MSNLFSYILVVYSCKTIFIFARYNNAFHIYFGDIKAITDLQEDLKDHSLRVCTVTIYVTKNYNSLPSRETLMASFNQFQANVQFIYPQKTS